MKAKKLFISFVVLGLLGLVGSMDYQDELVEEQHYCEMIENESWPAFDDAECDSSK